MQFLKRSAVALIAIATLLFAGCGGSGGSDSSSNAEAKTGGTLRVADFGEAVTLNPPEAVDAASIHVMTQINETLFRTNPEGEVEPWLVTDAKQSSDHLSWTFQLRPGISFSNGQKLTSADVVFSLEKLRVSEVWTAMFEPITSVKATSPSTVVVKTSRPVANLETELSVYGAGIVPKDYAGESPKDFGQNPIGTGPFELAAWKHGESLTLQRNPDYWRSGEPLLDKVVFASVPNDNSRVSQLKGGELDLISTPSWSQIPALEGDQNLHVGIFSMAGSDYVILNLRKPPFDDPKIREAASFAIDREGIVKAAYNGYGDVAGSWFAPALKYHDDSIEAPAQDLAKAKQLVSEAGSKPSLTLMVISGETAAVTAAQIIQQNLQEAGFSVKLQPLEEAALIETVAGGKFDASLLGYSSDIVDPSEQTGFYAATEGVFSGAETKQIGELGTAASSSFDEEKTASIYAEIQQKIDDEKGVVMFSYRPIVWAMQSNVAGFNLSPTGIPWFAEVGFSG